MKDLKPCPFCGGKNIMFSSYPKILTGLDSSVVFVQCTDCGATFPHFKSESEAIETWNRRVNDEKEM